MAIKFTVWMRVGTGKWVVGMCDSLQINRKYVRVRNGTCIGSSILLFLQFPFWTLSREATIFFGSSIVILPN